MHPLFKSGQDVLSKGGGDDVLDLGAKKGDLHLLVRFTLQHVSGEEHFTEDRRCFRQGKRCMVVDHGLLLGEGEVDAVPQFVCYGGHVAQVAGKVEKDVWGKSGGHSHAEGAAALADAGKGVNPAVLEKGGGYIPKFGFWQWPRW